MGRNNSNCAVAECSNYGRKTVGVIYHSFPKNVDLQKQWMILCKRADKINVNNARVCSDHFLPGDYERDLKNELLGLPVKKKLLPTAVPSQRLSNLHGETSLKLKAETAVQAESERQERCQKREIRKRALSKLQTISPKKKKIEQATITAEICVDENEEIKRLKKTIDDLKKRNTFLEISLNNCKASLKKAKNLRYVVKKKEPATSHHVRNETISKVKTILGKCFTPGQIRCLLRNNRRVTWSAEDIASALALRALSRKTYFYLRKRNIPLPSRSTLQKWTKNFTCKAGILKEVLCLLKAKFENVSEFQKIAVLSFDEMNIDGRMCYDSSEDTVVGPHKNVQVVMLRGLFQGWKQPVYYGFDVTMTSELLKSIISQVEACGVNIVGVTCDMGGKNNKVWRELYVNIEKPYFMNPVITDQKIWVFYDVPHLLKLLRNHLLDDGVTLPDGTKFGKALIEELLNHQKSDISITHHISAAHVNVAGRTRQNVRMAAQLLSRRTAQALNHVLKKTTECNFVELVNDVFDILNSRIPKDVKTPLRSGYGLFNPSQENTLKRFLEVCPVLRFGKRNHPLPFQNGFLISIKSLIGLFQDMKKKNATYILTSRLNQDCLENFFSRIRGFGVFYNNPTPFEIRNRIRLLVLTGNASDIPLSKNTPVAEENCEPSTYCDDLEDLSTFISSELCIGITESRPTLEPNEDEEVQELLQHDVESEVFEKELQTDVRLDALKYIAGYVAFKCQNVDKSLGVCHEKGDITNVQNDWISVISRGGLLHPSPEWLDKVRQFEILFSVFHGPQISKCKNVITTLTALLQNKFPECHKKAIHLFVKTRTFIRIRHLNHVMKMSAMKKYAAKKNKLWVQSSCAKQ